MYKVFSKAFLQFYRKGNWRSLVRSCPRKEQVQEGPRKSYLKNIQTRRAVLNRTSKV